ncbi:hypothetical protein GCM10020331_018770 [Ectobacillus funiculus]
MLPTAVSQVTEQLLRVSTIVLLSLYFVANDFDVYTIGAGAMFGSVVGGNGQCCGVMAISTSQFAACPLSPVEQHF